MKSKLRLFILVACLVVAFDAAGATVSRFVPFNYNYLLGGSIALYLLAGYLGFRYKELAGGFQAGLIAGLADSTVGWALALVINPHLRVPGGATMFLISIVVPLVTLLGGLCGLSMAAIAKAIQVVRTEE